MTASQDSATAPASQTNKKIASSLLRYRVLAYATGIWLLVLTVDIIVKYGFGVHTPSWIAVVHGWVYFVYLIMTIDLAVKVRWPALRTVGTLLAGTIPFLSFVIEHRRTAQVKRDFNV
ncbi:DUF3817 domain-containing protein [Antrihabitans cavernicola]|uniref:DUF3817 domain-containing protein n=1 Tax=Antrihabitans cavernicola TaxID=2495913 RepID=A0A5A7SE07_9NOCA|nr:DUF3817 domain-containing protein [Spelaeibacter cavernicola]KAA0022843.1 DUF3817 domain-containing protein [Spelaeibacter cavernicola]